VIVTIPVLAVFPPAMVRMGLLLKVKSPVMVGVIGSTETVSMISWLDGGFSIAVTVAALEIPLSLIVRDESAKVTVGVSSSSTMVNSIGSGGAIPLPPDAVA